MYDIFFYLFSIGFKFIFVNLDEILRGFKLFLTTVMHALSYILKDNWIFLALFKAHQIGSIWSASLALLASQIPVMGSSMQIHDMKTPDNKMHSNRTIYLN